MGTNYIQNKHPDMPARMAAGAALRVSVMMARALDNEAYPESCREALENVLAELVAAKKPTN